jgi:hypothetical protein
VPLGPPTGPGPFCRNHQRGARQVLRVRCNRVSNERGTGSNWLVKGCGDITGLEALDLPAAAGANVRAGWSQCRKQGLAASNCRCQCATARRPRSRRTPRGLRRATRQFGNRATILAPTSRQRTANELRTSHDRSEHRTVPAEHLQAACPMRSPVSSQVGQPQFVRCGVPGASSPRSDRDTAGGAWPQQAQDSGLRITMRVRPLPP